MEMRQIRYFLAVEETGNFTKAAERVYVSQPALSAGIRALEDHLGKQLFIRGKKRATLTPAGRRFLRRAKKIVEEFSQAKREVGVGTRKNDIRIGIFEVFSIDNLVEMIKSFHMAHPQFSSPHLFGGTTNEVARMLGRGKVDIILTALKGDEKSDNSTPLYEENYVAVVPQNHPFAHRGTVKIMDFHQQPFVQREHCESFREAFQLFQEQGCEPDIICRTDQDSWIVRMVQAGLASTVIPGFRLIPGVVQLPIEDLNIRRTIGLRWASNLKSGPVNTFKEFATSYDWETRNYKITDCPLPPDPCPAIP